jgi:hypothetical protein
LVLLLLYCKKKITEVLQLGYSIIKIQASLARKNWKLQLSSGSFLADFRPDNTFFSTDIYPVLNLYFTEMYGILTA